jgi:hypothetical protein
MLVRFFGPITSLRYNWIIMVWLGALRRTKHAHYSHRVRPRVLAQRADSYDWTDASLRRSGGRHERGPTPVRDRLVDDSLIQPGGDVLVYAAAHLGVHVTQQRCESERSAFRCWACRRRIVTVARKRRTRVLQVEAARHQGAERVLKLAPVAVLTACAQATCSVISESSSIAEHPLVFSDGTNRAI